MIYVSSDGRTATFNPAPLNEASQVRWVPGTQQSSHAGVLRRKAVPFVPQDQCCQDCRRRFNITAPFARCSHWATRRRQEAAS